MTGGVPVTLPQLYREQFHADGFRAVHEACCGAFECVFRFERAERFLQVQTGGLKPNKQGTGTPDGADQLGKEWDHGVFFCHDHRNPPGQFYDCFLIVVRTQDLPARVAFDYSFGEAASAALVKRNELGCGDPGAVALHSIRLRNTMVSYDALPAESLRVRQLHDGDDHTTWLPIAQVSPASLWRSHRGIWCWRGA